MKILVLILCLFLGPVAAQAVVALPAFGNTNELSRIHQDDSMNAIWQSHYYCVGRIDRMEHELNQLEAGFVMLAVLLGSSLLSISLLAIRDQIQKQRAAR